MPSVKQILLVTAFFIAVLLAPLYLEKTMSPGERRQANAVLLSNIKPRDLVVLTNGTIVVVTSVGRTTTTFLTQSAELLTLKDTEIIDKLSEVITDRKPVHYIRAKRAQFVEQLNVSNDPARTAGISH